MRRSFALFPVIMILLMSGVAFAAGPVSVTVAAPDSGAFVELSGVVADGADDRLSRFVNAAGLFELYEGRGEGLLADPPEPPPTRRAVAVTLTLATDQTTGFWIYPNGSSDGPLVQIIREYGTRNTWYQADRALIEVLDEMGIELSSDAGLTDGWASPWLMLGLAGFAGGVLVGTRLRRREWLSS